MTKSQWMLTFDGWCLKNGMNKAPEKVLGYLQEAVVAPMGKKLMDMKEELETERRKSAELLRVVDEQAGELAKLKR